MPPKPASTPEPEQVAKAHGAAVDGRVRKKLADQRTLVLIIVAASALTAGFGYLAISEAYHWLNSAMFVAVLAHFHAMYREERRTNRELMEVTRHFHDSVIAALDQLLEGEQDDDDGQDDSGCAK